MPIYIIGMCCASKSIRVPKAGSPSMRSEIQFSKSRIRFNLMPAAHNCRGLGWCAIEAHDHQGDKVCQHIGSGLRELCSGADEGNAHCTAQNTIKSVGG